MSNATTKTGLAPVIDPSKLRIRVKQELPSLKTNRAWAAYWYAYGFSVIPIVPGGKQSVVFWDPWLQDLSEEAIGQHWSKHPNHEVGFVVGPDMVVFDADTQQAERALKALEAQYRCQPSLVVTTSKGSHHYLRLSDGAFAKSDSHDTAVYPDRIDVKANRGLIVLPPSTGKRASIVYADHASKFETAGQNFIDAVFQHNGRPVPRKPLTPSARLAPSQPVESQRNTLTKLLTYISPDCGYDDWTRVLMAVFHETQGSDDGLTLVDQWSSSGDKYKGIKEIQTKWRSFRLGIANPVTVRTLAKLAFDNGADGDIIAHLHAPNEQFELCETEVIEPEVMTSAASSQTAHPLTRYSLLGRSQEVQQQAVEQRPALGQVALLGQVTVWYAAPNTGKTLIALSLLIQGIEKNVINPSKTFYVNVDDSGSGLLQKLQLADEYGFHMLAEGYRDFKAEKFLGIIEELTATNQVHGMVIILDTVKRFTNLMDKTVSSRFTKIVRNYVVKGGTLLALAHTNKNLGRDGKPVYGGTSDVLDDIDCGYTLMALEANPESGQKVIEFNNIKRRGDVDQTTAYTYSTERNISYSALLASVQPLDPTVLGSLKQVSEVIIDADVIGIIQDCIKSGIDTKMKLIGAVASHAKISRKAACKTIEKYTGDKPGQHLWSFKVQARGAQVFALLDAASADHIKPTAPG